MTSILGEVFLLSGTSALYIGIVLTAAGWIG